MDDALYQEKQRELFKRHEAQCIRCGSCCGAFDEDPCGNLAKADDGRYFCRGYENRVGQQTTRAGKKFHCIPIRDLYLGVAPYPRCAYAGSKGRPAVDNGGDAMNLYLIQHGEAVDKEVNSERPLSDKGRKETRDMAAFLKERKLRVSEIWHSGRLRSIETANIIAECVAHDKIGRHEGLDPADPVRPVGEEIKKTDRNILIVGHLPFLQKLTAYLVCGNEEHASVAFRYSSVVCLERGAHWSFSWFITPEFVNRGALAG